VQAVFLHDGMNRS